MYFATGADEIRQTLGFLLGVPGEAPEMRHRLGAWLASREGADVIGDPRHEEVDIVDDVTIETRLLRSFVAAPQPGDIAKPVTEETCAALASHRDAAAVRAKQERVREAAALLRTTCPGLGQIFDTVIQRVFCVEMAGEVGGSSTKSVGVIWANPTASASAFDLAEFLVHEHTHQLLFLDEQVHGFFTDRLGAETGSNGFMPRSSIRGARRPLGLVFHSLAVALELVAFRQLFADDAPEPKLHPGTDQMLAAAQETIQSIVFEPGWHEQFRSRGRFLFEAYRELWDQLAAKQHGVIPALLGE
ncbi:MAG TPA: HEXXH motif-containing putative peptide modification protein [Kofleriaceae bacterium]|jgi:hypothetical protein